MRRVAHYTVHTVWAVDAIPARASELCTLLSPEAKL